MTWTLIAADCVQAMQAMDADSIDAVVTDPPYGLEFMGKEWDRLDAGLPQEAVWKGRRGQGGSSVGEDDSRPGSRHHVALGATRGKFKRCTTCGKRQFSGSPCVCSAPTWIIETPDGPPSGMVRMQRWHTLWAEQALRVLKPGGHLLSFGGTRTYHRLVCALEDAGFEIRDCLAWFYGSGFPKSLDVSKAIDKAAGAAREVVGPYIAPDGNQRPNSITETDFRSRAFRSAQGYRPDGPPQAGEELNGTPKMTTAPATPDAERWQGWGTALKPAFEPIVLARKPLSGTVAENVLRHGVGALNVDGTRIGTDDTRSAANRQPARKWAGGEMPMADATGSESGRWPANVLLDADAAAALDEQAPNTGGGLRGPNCGLKGGDKFGGQTYGDKMEQKGYPEGSTYADSGGASRFFKVVEPCERCGGVGFYPSPTLGELYARCDCTPNTEAESRFFYTAKTSRSERENGAAYGEDRNNHPTVKPVDLMQWLCRLITPPKGLILDPFTGSGSTGIAALREGFSFIGIEREPDYVEIARARIIGDAPLFNVSAEV